MTDLCPRIGAGCNANRFPNGFDETVAFIPDVSGITTLVGRRVLRELDQFVGREERTRQVDQSGADAEGAIAHRRIDQRAHPPNFVGSWMTRRITHHRFTYRARPDICAEVDCGSLFLEK